MGKFKRIICSVMAFAFVMGFSMEAKAEYPEKPITLVSPYGAGGDSDVSARIWAEFARKELGQPVLVVNKTGAGGLTGTLFAAKAKPNGYTLFLGQAGPCIMVPLITKTGGLNKNSFDYLSRFILTNSAVVANTDAPWNNLKEFQEAALKEPGKYIFSSPSATSWLALAFRSWLFQNGVKAKVVEYTSGAEGATSILGKHGDVTFLFPPNYTSLVDSGKLKILAIGAKSDKYPDVPTFAELGYKGNYYGWSGIVIPKGAPQEIKDKLIAVTDKISKDPEFIKAITNLGFTPDNTSGLEWQKQVDAQYQEMHTVLNELGYLAK